MNGIRMPRLRVQLFPRNDDLPQSWRPMEAGRPFTAPFVLRWRAETSDWGPAPSPVPQRYEVRLAGPGCDQPSRRRAPECGRRGAGRSGAGVGSAGERDHPLRHRRVRRGRRGDRLQPPAQLREGRPPDQPPALPGADPGGGGARRHGRVGHRDRGDDAPPRSVRGDAHHRRRRAGGRRSGLAGADRSRRRLRDGRQAGAGARRGAGLGPGGRGAVRAAHPGTGFGRTLHRREPGGGVQAGLRVLRR